MSWRACINCGVKVPLYEKYCTDCLKKLKVAQDEDWHKKTSDIVYAPKAEISKDILKNRPKSREQVLDYLTPGTLLDFEIVVEGRKKYTGRIEIVDILLEGSIVYTVIAPEFPPSPDVTKLQKAFTFTLPETGLGMGEEGFSFMETFNVLHYSDVIYRFDFYYV